jgi:hypothetical protein
VDKLYSFRFFLSGDQSLGVIFFLPLQDLPPPIGTSIPPQVKVDVKMLGGDPLHGGDQGTNLL